MFSRRNPCSYYIPFQELTQNFTCFPFSANKINKYLFTFLTPWFIICVVVVAQCIFWLSDISLESNLHKTSE